MTADAATAEVFWKAFRTLTKREKEAFMQKLLTDRRLREDLIDIAIPEQRRKEPSRPLENYLTEREGKKK